MNKVIKRLVAVCLIATASIGTQSAHAVSAQTTVEVSFPTILILYHFDTISLSVTEANMATALGGLNNASCDAGAVAGEYCVQIAGPSLLLDLGTPTVDAGMDTAASGITGLSTVNVDISNAWGVRSLGVFTGLTAGVTGPTDLDDGNGELIPLDFIGTNDTSPPRGLGNPLATGDILFQMDLTNLDTSGDYTGAFTITITSI